MKIGLIRHFPVNQPFMKGWVRQSEVLQWFNAYNTAPVQESKIKIPSIWHRCYSSQLPRAVATAATIFSGPVVQTELLNEPGPYSVFKKDVKLPFLAWAMIMRWAIIRGHPSQPHSKAVMERRIQQFLQPVYSEEGNTLIVSHALVMEILSLHLIQHGFKGQRLSNPKNGVLHMYEK